MLYIVVVVSTCSTTFLKDPIFAERQYAKISQSNFRGWTFRVPRMLRLGFYFADLIFEVCQ